MKKLFLIALVAMLGFSSCKYDDSDLWNKVNEYGESIKDHENRIVALEEACKQINTNVKALQVLVNAIDVGDYITSITPVMKDGEEVGYAISFSQSSPITIYHGQDGENGIDGVDGKDGYTPKIGVKKYTDGIYYWTLDGTWLLDSNNQRIQAVGIDGKDGVDGTNGSVGKDGADGITPRLKIENDFWYVSYNNGATWAQLGKATGEDGTDGSNGEDGDSIFTSVTQDDECVYFNLADGTMITLPKHDKENIQFEDLQVKAICCKNWDTNYDGELSYAEAAAVTDIGGVFMENKRIISFGEFKYFTGLTEIAGFSGCDHLYRISIPNSAITIGKSAFKNCVSLLNVIIPNNVTTIGEAAFYGCTSIKSITISDSVITIEKSAFNSCDNLANIIFGNSVSLIGEKAFYSCDGLTNITIPDCVTSIGPSAFEWCSNLENVIIGDGVQSLGNHAFYNCQNLYSITIGYNISKIFHGALSGYDEYFALRKVYCKAMIPPAIYYGDSSSDNDHGIKPASGLKIYVPRESLVEYTKYTKGSSGNTSAQNWYYYKSYVTPYDYN